MKNMRKRILSLMVVLMMSLSLVQPTAFAATVGEGTEAGGSGDINIQTVVVWNPCCRECCQESPEQSSPQQRSGC